MNRQWCPACFRLAELARVADIGRGRSTEASRRGQGQTSRKGASLNQCYSSLRGTTELSHVAQAPIPRRRDGSARAWSQGARALAASDANRACCCRFANFMWKAQCRNRTF
jgi:hypothetical protein